MSVTTRRVLIGAGAAAVAAGVALLVWYRSLYTPEGVELIESGGDPDLVATTADLYWALTGVALAAVGVTVILVGILRRRDAHTDQVSA